MSPLLLRDAAQALEGLAQRRDPQRARILAGIAALDSLQVDSSWHTSADDSGLVDAAAELLQRAIDGMPNLDAASRAQAADLAHRVREIAASATSSSIRC